MPYKNKEKRKEYNRKYREENKERISGYRERNRDEYSKYQHEWYQANKDCKQRYYESQLDHCVYLLELPDCRMYVGSTNFLKKRLMHHRQDAIKKPNIPLYQAIKAVGGWDQVKVHVLMKNIPDRDLRHKIEQHFIDLVPTLLRLNVYEVRSQKAS